MRVYICPDATNFDELQFPPGPPGTGFVMPIGTAQDDEEAEGPSEEAVAGGA